MAREDFGKSKPRRKKFDKDKKPRKDSRKSFKKGSDKGYKKEKLKFFESEGVKGCCIINTYADASDETEAGAVARMFRLMYGMYMTILSMDVPTQTLDFRRVMLFLQVLMKRWCLSRVK